VLIFCFPCPPPLLLVRWTGEGLDSLSWRTPLVAFLFRFLYRNGASFLHSPTPPRPTLLVRQTVTFSSLSFLGFAFLQAFSPAFLPPFACHWRLFGACLRSQTDFSDAQYDLARGRLPFLKVSDVALRGDLFPSPRPLFGRGFVLTLAMNKASFFPPFPASPEGFFCVLSRLFLHSPLKFLSVSLFFLFLRVFFFERSKSPDWPQLASPRSHTFPFALLLRSFPFNSGASQRLNFPPPREIGLGTASPTFFSLFVFLLTSILDRAIGLPSNLV